MVVATDSIKNTIYIKAKENPVNPPELYASILGKHFLDTYPHISTANISVIVHRWTRMTVDGKPHPHSFFRDGQETRNVEAVVKRDGITLKSSIAGLMVLVLFFTWVALKQALRNDRLIEQGREDEILKEMQR